MSEQIVDSRDGRPRLPRFASPVKRFADRASARDWLIIDTERLRMADIAAEVACRHGLMPVILYSKRRTARVFNARAEAMLLCRSAGHRVNQIARHFGKDHSTVLHAIERAELRLKMGAV